MSSIKEGYPDLIFDTVKEKIPSTWATMPFIKVEPDDAEWETRVAGKEWERTVLGMRTTDGDVRITLVDQGNRYQLIASGPDERTILDAVNRHLPTELEIVLQELGPISKYELF